ncbi:creatininase family protein, partial [Eubacteriales bacterium DFI.9.88]|nr:creatininase family protein [Eubacteriales bacterium DFI.9.88]
KVQEAPGIRTLPELCKAGSYIQTTPGKEQDEIRKKNDVVLIPIGCTEDHGPMNPSGMDTFMVTAIAEGVRRYTLNHGPRSVSLSRRSFTASIPRAMW